MAYLSEDDLKAQKDAGGSGGFDLSAKTSALGDSSDQQSQSNAGSYDQSYGGDIGGKSSPATSGNNSTGLGSATPGGGFVNFGAFEKANPDQSAQISNAGHALVGSEMNNFNSQTSANPDSGFSSDPYGAPGFGLSPYEKPPSSLTPHGGAETGGSAPLQSYGINPSTGTGLKDPGSVNDLIGSGTPDDMTKLGGWVNEHYTPVNYDYTPSHNWQESAPELSETPQIGGVGSAKPSVIDYLARPEIAAGHYSVGNRALDNAIIGGNAKDQAAITGNKGIFNTFATDAGKTLSDLQNRVAQNTALAPGIGTATTGALNDVTGQIMQAASDAAARAGAATSPDTLAGEKQAEDAFNTWFNGPTGPANGGVWTSNTAPPTAETPEQALTPAQITELNNIATLNGQAPPYPNGVPGGSAQPGYTGGSGTSVTAADPSIADQFQPGRPNGGTVSTVSIGAVYNEIGSGTPGDFDPKNPGNNGWMTPQEQAVAAVMNPGQANSYPPVTQQNLQGALSQLEGVLKAEQLYPTKVGNHPGLTPEQKASNIAAIQKEIGAVESALAAMSPSSPYAYGISIGMTPDQLAAMGIKPDNQQITTHYAGA